MPYIYRISRREPTATPVVKVKSVPATAEVTVPESSYRDLQAQAKELDIPTRQKAGKLKKAIAEAKRNG